MRTVINILAAVGAVALLAASIATAIELWDVHHHPAR